MRRVLRAAFTSVWSILAVALLLRTLFAWYYIHGRTEHALGVIPFLSEPGNIAHSLALGQNFSSPFLVNTGPTAWVAPVYPAMLAGVFRLFGVYTYHSFLAAVALNIAFITLACVPIFRVGERIAGAGVGAGAAWLWAVFPNAILIPVESIWDACLSALLLALILWATMELAESRSIRAWLGYGLLWGLALMTNPSLASVSPHIVRVGRVSRFGGPVEGFKISADLETCIVPGCRRIVLRTLGNSQLCRVRCVRSSAVRNGPVTLAGEQP